METPNWNLIITLDTASHLHWGMAEDELDKDELKELKVEFKKYIITGVTNDKPSLLESGHKVYVRATAVTVEGITPSTLMDICEKLLNWIGEIGDRYQDDLRAILPVDDILEYLEENDSELLAKFTSYMDDNYWD